MSKFWSNAARLASAGALAAGCILASSMSASATPTGCSTGTRESSVAGEYYGWAYCSGGTGEYQVTVTCYSTGGYYYDNSAAWWSVGSGIESRRGCAAGAPPVSVGYSLQG